MNKLLNKTGPQTKRTINSRINPKFTEAVPSARGPEVKERVRSSLKREEERLKKFKGAEVETKAPEIYQSY